MIVVVVGDLDRDSENDQSQVLELLSELKIRYSDLLIVSAACDMGIGKIVRNKCIANKNNPEFAFVEISIKPWSTMSPAKLSQIYMCKNPALVEIGEVFHIFSSGKTRGHTFDLLNRIHKSKRPLTIHDKTGKVTYYNYQTITENKVIKQGQTIQSSNLKDFLE